MEHALIALVSLSVTLTIYFDRVHRKDMSDRFTRIEKQFDKRFEEMDKRFEQVDKRFEQVDKRFEQVNESIRGLTASVIELARGVGRVEGRTEVLVTAE